MMQCDVEFNWKPLLGRVCLSADKVLLWQPVLPEWSGRWKHEHCCDGGVACCGWRARDYLTVGCSDQQVVWVRAILNAAPCYDPAQEFPQHDDL